MDDFDLTTTPVADHAELVSRLHQMHDEDAAAAILKDAEVLASKAAAGLFELAGSAPTPDQSGLAIVMMMGALRAGLLFLGASEDAASIACRHSIDVFNRTLATLQAGATSDVRH